ncbi:MAG: HEAT repeat domain-containing protein, partial [Spirochaetota bacterium]
LVKSLNIISELNLTEAVPSIKKHLSHMSEDVRIAAVYTLKDLKAFETKPEIIEKLKAQDFAKDSNFTEAMIQTLADFQATELKDFAVEKIKDNKTTKNIRLALLLYLGRSGAKDSKDFLIQMFSDPEEEMDLRAYAVNSIAKLDIKEALPAINKTVDEINSYSFQKKKEYSSLYLYCISALVKLGDANAYPRLIESLKSDNASTRIRSIKLLKDLKDKRSIDILKYKVKYDPSLQVQKEAKEALKAMGEKIEEVDNASPKKASPAPVENDPKKDPETAPPADDQSQNKREDF